MSDVPVGEAPGSDPPGAPVPVATVRDLRVTVDGETLVDGVSLTALPGRCTALVGASGSGKSTTGLALLGEYPAGAEVSGTVRVTGRAGYVPQNPAAALNPARRAGALLADIARQGGGSRRERAARVRAALSAAQLPDPGQVLGRYPHQLSGGQQQRVVLAQALLSGAPVVVADEPTTGQDALTKRRVVDELRAVLARGAAVVLLSHDLDVVRELADEVVVLRAGRVVEAGPADQVLTDPRHAWTARLLTAARPETPDGPETDGPPEEAGAAPDSGLRVDGLTAWHGRRRGGAVVLREASLTLGAGQCLAVVGRSGSGKTTLARCLAGLHRRWSGRAVLDGEPLPRSLRHRRREQLAAVQYVFQDAKSSFDEYRPVVEQVARTAVRLRALPPAAARQEALETLVTVGVGEDTASRRPGELSGGELQRAALARALLARPRVLLCDEITSGLDPVTQRGILALLAGLTAGAEGMGLVLITHDLAVAAELADRIAVIDDGRIVEQGPAAGVLTCPAHPFTRSLLTAMPVLTTPGPSS
ncbi:ATP-binding cassette domain-containing protein [Streptomyces sp. ACA25]|uniref:ABC transporter ATP-binding protein n=1 Tax=Streptomyces sp. ACA25 TaxID=3022596 RepID=UPI002307225E|nr:ATP-binding cassette domain-containing protein [Streptomyces sp. ACA25]MDB1086408.1 ATP-binding cassette domain-containing protein [Streptomyces sp. ACA25]